MQGVELGIPLVTENDLKDFHHLHFGVAPLPSLFWHDPHSDYYDQEPEEDGLGYYKDGVKRTLTEEQIAIFRHSEIQTLIKQRQASPDFPEAPVASLVDPEVLIRNDDNISVATESVSQVGHNTQKSNRNKKHSKKKKHAPAVPESAKRRRRNTSSPSGDEKELRHDPADYMSEDEDRTYRRRAREEDAQVAENIDLDY